MNSAKVRTLIARARALKARRAAVTPPKRPAMTWVKWARLRELERLAAERAAADAALVAAGHVLPPRRPGSPETERKRAFLKELAAAGTADAQERLWQARRAREGRS